MINWNVCLKFWLPLGITSIIVCVVLWCYVFPAMIPDGGHKAEPWLGVVGWIIAFMTASIIVYPDKIREITIPDPDLQMPQQEEHND